jgi:lipase ATG15
LIFFAFLFGVVALAAISSGSGAEEGAVPYTTFPSNNTFFYNVPQEKVSPICNADFGNSHDSNATSLKYLADYNFLCELKLVLSVAIVLLHPIVLTDGSFCSLPVLAIIPYFKIDSIQSVLDSWFGEGQAFLDEDVIPTFRELHPDLSSSASFQLVTFSDGSAVVCVRGSKTYFDFLTDARLWYASGLFQLFQGAMPFGSAFDALVHFCVNMLSILETENVKKVSYYVETTTFVNYLRKSDKYTNIAITGHSLGGGLALITGAQTQIMAVGFSAPNTVMGRSTVTPEISLDDLERYTYNVIPNRDIVPQLGGKSKFSSIKCRAGINEPFACHFAYRSLCELMYTCGNVKRPVYCECVRDLGYPEPIAIGGSGTSFESTCEAL